MKHIELLTQGYCSTDSIDNFISSEVGFIFREIHGELFYSEQPRPNFFNVHKDGEKFIISEGIYYDQFPNVEYVGSIVPAYLNFDTRINHRGGNSPIGRSLSKYGYVIKDTPVDDALIAGVKNMSFFEHSCLGKSTLEKPEDDGVVRVDHHHSYEMTHEYFNADANNVKYYQPDFIKNFLSQSRKDMQYLFADNYLISNSINPKTWVQKMTSGHELSPHFDGNFNKGISPFINATTWICDGSFSGRNFIAGRRTVDDLSSWIQKAKSSKELHISSVHELSPEFYTNTIFIKPETGKTAMINSFNPLFYHGVEQHNGGKPVFSIINDFQFAE